MPTLRFLLLLVACTLLVSGCNNEIQLKKTDADGKPIIFCSSGVCLLYPHKMVDQDGDNVSDEDELALMSDPFNKDLTPRFDDMMNIIGNGLLPSFNKGLSELLVLPEKTPMGKSLIIDKGPFVVSKFVRTREQTLGLLGITSEHITKLGIDIGKGLRLQIETAMASTQKPGALDRMMMRYSGVLISNKPTETVTTQPQDDGSTTVTTTSVTETVTDNGTITTETTTAVNTRPNSDGSVTITTFQTILTTQTRDGEVIATREETNQRTETLRPDGSRNGTDYHQVERTVFGITDVRGTMSDFEEKNGERIVKNRQHCYGYPPQAPVECSPADGYVDPDAGDYEPLYVPNLIVGGVDEITRIIEAKLGTRTTPGPVVEDPSFDNIPLKFRGPLNPQIILVDETYGTIYVATAPRITGAQPETDPRLNPIINDLPK